MNQEDGTQPGGLNLPDEFLEKFWQKKPCLIRRAFNAFEPMLDGNDLAGLACEDIAESRLVSGCLEDKDWRLEHGPFDEAVFSTLPKRNWTLLVQDVEKHYAPLQAFMQHFSFLPDWRLDDLMISYAVTGGSVGPHVDQYDVFLFQAEGRRCWQIAEKFQPELAEECPLNMLRHFKPEQEWVLEPGDMLYLPPNIAHHGVALEPGMTWSIGARAPSLADLLQGLGEWLAMYKEEGDRYRDPGLQAAARAGEVDRSALEGLHAMLSDGVTGEFNDFLAAFLSRFRLANEAVPPARMFDTCEVHKVIDENEVIFRNPWSRLVWIRTPNGARLFAGGQPYECSIALATALCEHDTSNLSAAVTDDASVETLTQLVNDGHFVISGSMPK